jgi:uncharacterized Zn-finger protein
MQKQPLNATDDAEQMSWRDRYPNAVRSRKFRCPACPKAFTAKSNLEYHWEVHATVKNVRCQYKGCGKMFASSTAMKLHARNHPKRK